MSELNQSLIDKISDRITTISNCAYCGKGMELSNGKECAVAAIEIMTGDSSAGRASTAKQTDRVAPDYKAPSEGSREFNSHSPVASSEILDNEPDITKCPGCGGPADNGFDRCLPPSPYYCTKCENKPVMGDSGAFKMLETIIFDSPILENRSHWIEQFHKLKNGVKYVD